MIVPPGRDGQKGTVCPDHSDSLACRNDSTYSRQGAPEPRSQSCDSPGELGSRREQELVVLTSRQYQVKIPPTSPPVRWGKRQFWGLDDRTDPARRAQVIEVIEKTVAHIQHATD